MTTNVAFWLRLGAALAIGAAFDLFALRDAFAYSDRNWLAGHAMILFWPMLALVVVGAFILNLGGSRSSAGAATPHAWYTSLEAQGLLIPFAILLGATVARTVVLARELAADPTSHNLFPFEYLLTWIVVGVPALAGAMSARVLSWLINRGRAR